MKDAVLFQTFSFNNVSNSIPGPMHRHPSFFNWVPVALKSTPSSSSKTWIWSRSSTRKETALPAFVSRMQRPLVCWNTRWFFSFCFLHVSNYWFADLSVRCTCLRLPVRCTQTGSDTHRQAQTGGLYRSPGNDMVQGSRGTSIRDFLCM